MILIIGKGDLAQAVRSLLPDALLLGRPEFDFALQADCDRLLAQYPDPTVVINTLGCITPDPWHNLTVNLVAPAYITLGYLSKPGCHIVNISSASAWWVSHPGLDPARFSYNLAKECVSSLGRHLNRITIDHGEHAALISTIEPGRFKSRLSGYTGQEISAIAEAVVTVVQHRFQHLSCIR